MLISSCFVIQTTCFFGGDCRCLAFYCFYLKSCNFVPLTAIVDLILLLILNKVCLFFCSIAEQYYYEVLSYLYFKQMFFLWNKHLSFKCVVMVMAHILIWYFFVTKFRLKWLQICIKCLLMIFCQTFAFNQIC